MQKQNDGGNKFPLQLNSRKITVSTMVYPELDWSELTLVHASDPS